MKVPVIGVAQVGLEVLQPECWNHEKMVTQRTQLVLQATPRERGKSDQACSALKFSRVRERAASLWLLFIEARHHQTIDANDAALDGGVPRS